MYRNALAGLLVLTRNRVILDSLPAAVGATITSTNFLTRANERLPLEHRISAMGSRNYHRAARLYRQLVPDGDVLGDLLLGTLVEQSAQPTRAFDSRLFRPKSADKTPIAPSGWWFELPRHNTPPGVPRAMPTRLHSNFCSRFVNAASLRCSSPR